MSSAPSPATSATSTASSTAHSHSSTAAGGGGEVTQRAGGRTSKGDDQPDEGKPPLASDAALLNSPLALGESRALPSATAAAATDPKSTPTPVGERGEIGGGQSA
jgi:hypothetical protein